MYEIGIRGALPGGEPGILSRGYGEPCEKYRLSSRADRAIPDLYSILYAA
jgi:hypothetical protein